MAKQVFFNQEAREKLRKGMNVVADAAGSTLGARGKGVFISGHYGAMPIVTKDGVTVVRSTFLKDEIENVGVMLIRGAAEKQLETCGDGTTACTVLAQSILNAGMDPFNDVRNAQQIKSGIEKAVASVVASLDKMAVPVESVDSIRSIATIAANNDPEIGAKLAEAYAKIGYKGLLTIEDSKTIDTYVKTMDGAEMPRGWASEHFVTDRERMEVVYENPMILVVDHEIKQMKDLEPIMIEIASSPEGWSRAWIIIARGFDGEVYNTMVVNKLKNNVKLCLIQAPTAYQKEALIDIACLTGANLICEEFAKKTEHATMSDLGTCKKIVVSKNSTLIIEGVVNKDGLENIKKSIATQRAETDNDQLKDILDKRLARLTGSIGIIYVGGATDVERKERKDRVDDAKRAVESAVEEGVVVGGGVALIRCIKDLDSIKAEGDESIGVDLIRNACMAPLRLMLNNAGLDPLLADRVRDELVGNNGYDVRAEAQRDLFEAGIIDPKKVVRCALQNAASVAGQVLTGEVLLVEMKE